MAIAQAVTCDVCGKVKGEVNHWFMFNILPHLGGDVGIVIWPWDKKVALDFKHVCGAECVTKAVNKWMQEQAA